MIAGIDHLNLVVRDLEAARSFFVELLEFRETRRARLEGGWIDQVTGLEGVVAEVLYLEPPAGPRLELLRFEQPEYGGDTAPLPANAPGLRHLALRVEDMDAAVERLKAAGVEFLARPVAVPAGIVRHDQGDKRLVYFRGPEGLLLELAEYC